MRQAAAIDDRMIGQVFSIGSESQRTAFLKMIQTRIEGYLSLIWRHLGEAPDAVRAALDLVLRRKAIGAEALAAQRDAVLGGRYPALEPQLREWSTLRGQIAQKTLAGPGPEGLPAHRQLLAQWNQQKERLEAELARRIPEMNLEQKLRAADRRAVALALPAGVALIEFVRFDVFDFQAVPARGEPHWQPARYLAFVLPAGEPDHVQMIDLGEAEPIDRMIRDFRAGITGEVENRPGRDLVAAPIETRPRPGFQSGPGPAGGRLRQAGPRPGRLQTAAAGPRWRPDPAAVRGAAHRQRAPPHRGVRRQLPELRPRRAPVRGRVLGPARRAGGGRRPRLRPRGQDTPRAAPPDQGPQWFGFSAAVQPAVPRSGSEPPALRRLPGTRVEGGRIATMLGVPPWMDVAALEGRLKTCRSPRVLHLATHGFFLADQPRDPNKERRDLGAVGFTSGSELGRLSGAGLENPLLRSGLALAGVNSWLKGGSPPVEAEDGLLTAEDVSGLDLLDTDLVVLSACETGLGEIHVGEGVFGLRRAFVLAGAKTLVMSLWKVPDQQTQELMVDFYGRILAGQGRADALREAQLALKAKYPDPLYWGAFICQGNPGPLPARPKVAS